MENNEISMFMDIKLELHERKKETAPFKTWVKCLVKVEAIKCFPCYLRITFIRNVEDETANLCVRINIPGITIRLASSRTKAHSYGLFWKQNRKRCTIFFALDSQASCDRHMKWMKKSIKNLELHRQEILETRRTSRCSVDCLTRDNNFLAYQNVTTRDGKKLQDILGPLPKIPDFGESSNWSRRVSGFSGIYEEIPDGDRNSRRCSRTSVASGIYEEMKLPANFKPITEDVTTPPPPPPLPPRKRVNTFEIDEIQTIPRCHTNPEAEMAKKKKYLTVLENVFSRGKRSESVSEGKVSTAEELTTTPEKPIYENGSIVTPRPKKSVQKIFGFDKPGNKRNSFSSPDLTKFNQLDEFEVLADFSSVSSDLQLIDSSDCSASIDSVFKADDNSKNVEEIKCDGNDSALNISEQIQPNFNISCNSSTINLVGANLNTVQTPPSVIIDDLSGYCAMAPIRRERNSKPSNDSDKENDDCSIQNQSTEKVVYENMNALCNIYKNCNFNTTNNTSNIYQNVNFTRKSCYDLDNTQDLKDDLYKTPRKSINFDEKVPSYYPNSCDTQKVRKRIISNAADHKNNVRHLTSVKVSHRENHYISSPQKILDQRSRKCGQENCSSEQRVAKLKPLTACKISENIYSVTKNYENIPENELKQNSMVSISIECLQNEQNSRSENSSPRIYQKYATLARISPNKYIEKSSKKISTDFGTVKKFASLPRFKKIDFSPLKIKISSVLQRHQSDGL